MNTAFQEFRKKCAVAKFGITMVQSLVRKAIPAAQAEHIVWPWECIDVLKNIARRFT